MLHPDDDASLRRILRLQDGESIPPGVLHEYGIRKRMFDRDGNSGALRSVGLIDLVRFCGLAPPDQDKPAAQTDWQRVSGDGTVRVEAKFFGDWKAGCFLGIVQGGTLAVRLDGDEWVRELHRDAVRLAKAPEQHPVTVENPPADVTSAAGIGTVGILGDSQFGENETATEQVLTDTVSEESEQAGEQQPERPPYRTDWEALPADTVIWVNIDGDTHDAKFVKALDAERLIVKVKGEKKTREVAAVQCYEQAAATSAA